jgi:bifunctional pyridoxal-dependent enzyme with beta-cystathionase and maltose regulon repressor activities
VLILTAITVSILCTPGCVGKGQIAAVDVQEVVQLVCDRHDVYVASDSSLVEIQRDVYLRSTELLRAIVRTAIEEAE